ncbi:TolC family protein [Pseudoduganella sp. GCM10020061]|uniref:TolC family protein n=1 Tax=Pseudoduganella sp. GCM10020061 TaxID=3317345 RepID=UPI00362BE08B
MLGGAAAADPALTLERAQQLAVERSYSLKGKDDALASAREMASAARQLPDPVLKAGIENLPLDGPERFSLNKESMTMRRIGLMQEFPRSDKRRLRAELFEREADKVKAQKAVQIVTIQRDTALAWLDLYYAQAQAALLAEQLVQARLEIEAAEAAYRAGRGRQADIIDAKKMLIEIEDRRSQSTRMIANARVRLARWVGDASGGTLAQAPVLDRIAYHPTEIEDTLAHHPDLNVMALDEAIAQTNARLARANRKADWSVEVAYQKRGSAFSDMVSVELSLPLQWDRKNRQDRELSASLSLAAHAKAERQDAERAHVAEVREMYNEWQSNSERLARFQRELLPLADAGTQAATAAYRGGKASLAEVLSTRRGEIETRLQVLQLEAETARLWAQLNFQFPHEGTLAAQPNKDVK